MTRYIEHMPIDSVVDAEKNPKAHDLATLGKSIERWGFNDAPILDDRTGRLVAGHGRFELLRQWKEAGGAAPDGVEVDVTGRWLVPVQRGWSSKDDQEAQAFLLAHNKISEAGGWHADQLTTVLQELQAHYEPLGGLGILPLGFSETALSQLLAEPPAAGEDPGPQEPPAVARSKTGELYLLGPHRLLCGDSTNAEDVARVMDGERATLMATDPPYLVDYDGTNHPNSHHVKAGRTTTGTGDEIGNKHWDDYNEASKTLFVDFLRVALPHLDERAPVYQWHASRRQALVEAAWEANGLFVHQTIQWVKNRGVLTRSHFLWRSEPCFYGWRVGMQPEKDRRPPSNQTNVWELDTSSIEMKGIHPTQKPLEVCRWPISWHMKPGEVCFEPFGGSGTCLIAAALEGRRCFTIEMSPAFCDAIRIRWTRFAASAGVDPGPGALEPEAA